MRGKNNKRRGKNKKQKTKTRFRIHTGMRSSDLSFGKGSVSSRIRGGRGEYLVDFDGVKKRKRENEGKWMRKKFGRLGEEEDKAR